MSPDLLSENLICSRETAPKKFYEMLSDEVVLFLNMCGLFIPIKNGSENSCRVWATLVGLSMLLSLGFECYQCVLFLARMKEDQITYIIYRAISYPTLLLQMSVSLPAAYQIRRRLHSTTFSSDDVPKFVGYSRTCWIFLFATLATVIIFPICGFAEKNDYINVLQEGYNDSYQLYFSVMLLGECATCFYLAPCLLFTLVDVAAGLDSVDLMLAKSENFQLKFEEFSHTRNEVIQRQADSNWTDYLVLVGILNVFGFIARVLEAPGVIGWLGAVAYSLKEILYLAVVFIFVAELNERADKLHMTLISSRWPSVDFDCTRQAICALSHLSPISFRLAGFRLTRVSLLLNLAGFVLTVLFAIVRLLIQYL